MAFLDIPKFPEEKITQEAKVEGSVFGVDMETVSPLEADEQRLSAIPSFSLDAASPRRKRGWEATIGTLDNNPLIQEIVEAGECIRQSERCG